MRTDGRVVLSCNRILQNGVPEHIRVVVRMVHLNDAKKNYESQGYTVTIVEE